MNRRERQLARDVPVLGKPLLVHTDVNTVSLEGSLKIVLIDDLVIRIVDNAPSDGDTFLSGRRLLVGVGQTPFFELFI